MASMPCLYRGVFFCIGGRFMEQILLISATEKETDSWSNLIELAGNFDIHVFNIKHSNIENLTSDVAGIAWIVGSDMQEDVLENVIFNCKEKSIPVVCTDCHSIRGYTVSHLISMGVKAVVNLHFSVIRIKEVMNIVQEGGIYMHNTNRTK